MIPPDETPIRDSFAVRRLNGTDRAGNCRLAYHHILFVTKGAGRLHIDESTFAMADNVLFLMSRGQLYAEDQDLRMEGYEIAFGDCFWDRTPASVNNCKAALFNNAAGHQCLPLGDEDAGSLLPHITALYNEAAAGPYINKLDVLAAFLKIIMIKIANIRAALAHGHDNEEKALYHRFIGLVGQQFGSTHEVADYARQLNVTARRLSDICRRSAGKGAKDVINGQLITEAKRQLQFSGTAIKEIAYNLNFATPEHFTRFFKQWAQCLPSDYRSRTVNMDR